MLTDDQGRIVAVGSGNRFDLARYGPNGVLDPSFGARGKVITLFGSSGAYAAAAALDSRGRIVVAGAVGSETGSDLALARYTGKDATPPDVTIEGRRIIRTRHHRARPRFRFSASEPATFECAIDGGQARRCASPYRTPKLPTGRHRLKVFATDAAGNVGSAGKRFRIKRRR